MLHCVFVFRIAACIYTHGAWAPRHIMWSCGKCWHPVGQTSWYCLSVLTCTSPSPFPPYFLSLLPVHLDVL